jgi:hypothetical protein
VNDESSKNQAVEGTIVNTLSNSRSGFHLEIEADMGFCMGDRVWISRTAPVSQPAEQPIRDATTFEQWYVDNAFDLKRNPVGSRDCHLQRKAWHAALSLSLPDAIREYAISTHTGDDWKKGFFDRWNDAAKEKGYAGIGEAIDAAQPKAATGAEKFRNFEISHEPRTSTADQAVATAGDEVTDEQVREWCERHEIFSLGSHLTDARAAFEDAQSLASPSAPRVGVPEGWKLVPVETTVEMRESWMEANCSADAEWAAMLAAAPEVPK